MKMSNVWLLIILLISMQILTAGNIDQYQKRKIENQKASIKIQTLTATLVTITNVYQEIEDHIFPYIWPIYKDDYIKLTSPFGYRELVNIFTGGTRESDHRGVDVVGTYKARIISIDDGIVIEHYPAPNGYFKGHSVLGGMIKIKHGEGWTSVYGHLAASYVKEGDIVNRGDIIGRQGNTGLSQGNHLHLELRHNNIAVNPLLYIKEN